jgi:hypothetical protein
LWFSLREVADEVVGGLGDSGPELGAEVLLKTVLELLPAWERAAKLGASGGGEVEEPLAAVFVAAAFDPAMMIEGSEGAGEGGAVQREDVAEGLLVNGAGLVEYLKDRELRGFEAGWAELFVVERGERPGCSPEGGACAGELEEGGSGLHGNWMCTHLFPDAVFFGLCDSTADRCEE